MDKQVKLDTIQMQPGHEDRPHVDDRDFLARLEDATGFQIEKGHEVSLKPEFPFTIRDQKGDKIFSVDLHCNMWCRLCCRSSHAFRLEFKDMAGEKVFVFERDYDFSCCCSLIRPDCIKVSSHDGQPLGKVIEAAGTIYPGFKIVDQTGERILRIDGPFLPSLFVPCRDDISFKIRSLDKTLVGNITRVKNPSLCVEFFATTGFYTISFASDLDPTTKILLLSAFFLINCKHYDRDPEGRKLARMLTGR